MKRTFVFLLAAALLMTACTREIRTEKLLLKEEVPFSEGSAFHYGLDLDIDFPVAGLGNDALAAMRQHIRTLTLGDPYTGFTGPVDDLKAAWRNAAVDEYRTSNEDLLKEMNISEAEAFNLNWETMVSGSFGNEWDGCINYLVEQYTYEGGAHGMSGLFPVVFDKSDGQPVPWSRFAPGISEAAMTELIDRHKFDDLEDTLSENGIDTDNIFYVDTIEPSRWYDVDKEGLTFFYQPYDVAPYVFGVIEITVPWEELK